jgi:polysaccharide deacetylase family protein (PEP-CTERM system associated)
MTEVRTHSVQDGLSREPLATRPLTHAFSVDVEDYFHVEAFRGIIDRSSWDDYEPRAETNTLRLLDMLGEHSARATFFTLGWVAERNPGLIAEIHDRGHELAVHSYDHTMITKQTPQEFRSDLRRSKEIIEDIISEPVVGFRAPTYSIVEETMWALEILGEEGFLYDSSIFPIAHDRYGIPNAERFPFLAGDLDKPIVEFPISTIRLFGRNMPFVGGGYMRLLPMAYVRWGMRKMVEEGRSAVVYIHPWEIDPDQPVQDIGKLARLRHYGGLARMESRVRNLMEAHRFTTMRDVLGL